MATQAERTASTTEKLLDATVGLLIERGYRNTSLPEICKSAGVSRGAQLHHYPTKEALVAAAIEHLLVRRVRELGERLARASERSSGVFDLGEAASNLWSIYTGDTFYAWLELVVAARTEPELQSMLAAVDKRFAERAEQLCQKFLMPHVEDKEEIAATARLILAMFDGLATHRILSRDDAAAKRALKVAARAGLFTRRSQSGGDA
jgi:AcrR family transcriptional regulator